MQLNEFATAFKYKLKIQIRFKDIDKLGHVNNAVHLTYFETVRVDYFKDVFRKKNDWNDTNIVLAHSEITYKRPIFLEDTLYCYTKITRFGTKSFDMENVLVVETETGEQVCAFGKSTMVCFNYKVNQTVNVPQDWIDSVYAFEK